LVPRKEECQRLPSFIIFRPQAAVKLGACVRLVAWELLAITLHTNCLLMYGYGQPRVCVCACVRVCVRVCVLKSYLPSTPKGIVRFHLFPYLARHSLLVKSSDEALPCERHTRLLSMNCRTVLFLSLPRCCWSVFDKGCALWMWKCCIRGHDRGVSMGANGWCQKGRVHGCGCVSMWCEKGCDHSLKKYCW
jgi:hypothetical protein